ncbi:MAG: glutathione S-transferase N-terminal domain-containing protein, partial [Pseudomonadota bacterium]
MYQLYWAPDSGALAPHIVLEELGVEYQLSVVDLENSEETSSNYLSVNPRGQVPALMLDDGTIMTESAAILLHLAERHPEAALLPEAASPERARLYRWLFYAA